MRLCIVTPSVIKGDGQGRANYEIVKEAIRRQHSVTVVASRVAPEIQQSDWVRWVEIVAKGLPTALLREMIFSRESAKWLRQHRHNFDVVQAYGCVTSAIADVNTVQFVHDGWRQSPAHISRQQRNLKSAYHWLYTQLNVRWERNALCKASTVVAVSHNVAKDLQNIGVAPARIQIIFNGVDVQEFSPGTVARTLWDLPEAVPLALFAGDIKTNRKNLDTVLSALVSVPELHLAVVGRTYGSPYPQLAARLGATERVHFLGYRRDIPDIMKAADFFVFPSRYEPFGMVVSEAMATGLPVITCRSTGAAEIVTPEAGIVLENAEDRQGLVDAMKMLSRSPERRHQMGRAGRKIVQQHSWMSKAQQYVDLFESLASVSQPVLV